MDAMDTSFVKGISDVYEHILTHVLSGCRDGVMIQNLLIQITIMY